MPNSPEFVLLVDCCQSNFAAAPPRTPEIGPVIDWQLFVELARHHRVQGLVWSALGRAGLPAHAETSLSADATSIAATNLTIARECAKLRDAFAKARRPLLFVKGLTVAALAYRSPMLKMGWDIDLLIAPGDLLAAADLLEAEGYALRLPARRADLERWHAWSKETVWRGPPGLHVELHTRLADNDSLIPSIDVSSSAQQVEVLPGVGLATLAEDELVAYLAVHGASSAWFRLKWISDFAALLAGRTADDLERLYRRSLQLGAGRAAGQAFLLADRLFGTLNDAPALRGELDRDQNIRRLVRAAMAMLGQSPVEPTAQRFGTFAIHWSQFLLLPGIRYKASELRRQAAGLFKERLV